MAFYSQFKKLTCNKIVILGVRMIFFPLLVFNPVPFMQNYSKKKGPRTEKVKRF